MSEVKKMSIKEFREKGFLQEANRLFFHPLGLALEISVDWPEGVTDEDKVLYKDNPFNHPEAVYSLGGVWDYRDDPEGILFGDGIVDKNKVEYIESLRNSKISKRSSIDGCDENGIQQN